MQSSSLDERSSLVLTRTYPVAPRKLWRAWTDPDALRKWWNQSDSAGWPAELDVRVGGRYRVVLRDPEGVHHDFDPRSRDGWRGAFKRLGQLLQQTN